MTYSEKLKDPRWQKRRLKIMERDGFKCMSCDNQHNTLNVHHCNYSKEPWDAPDEDLATLCDECHERIGRIVKMINRQIVRPVPDSIWSMQEVYVAFGALMSNPESARSMATLLCSLSSTDPIFKAIADFYESSTDSAYRAGFKLGRGQGE